MGFQEVWMIFFIFLGGGEKKGPVNTGPWFLVSHIFIIITIMRN